MSTLTMPVPVEVDGATVLVEATCFRTENTSTFTDGEMESEVSGKIPSFDDVTKTITVVSGELAKALSTVKPTKAVVEFGVEFQNKSGSLLAVIVQGSGKVNLKITLEWSK
jgi:hypothetical protein